MKLTDSLLSRRSALALLGLAPVGLGLTLGPRAWAQTGAQTGAETGPAITVHRDPGCGCCGGWVEHLKHAGFATTVIASRELDAVKRRLGVPAELASCHTAEVEGYVVEGHVPASAIRRLLAERPAAAGLAVPGMPVGSPGMEGGTPETYEVVLFGPQGRRTFARYRGSSEL
jgi:hypothetical protein